MCNPKGDFPRKKSCQGLQCGWAGCHSPAFSTVLVISGVGNLLSWSQNPWNTKSTRKGGKQASHSWGASWAGPYHPPPLNAAAAARGAEALGQWLSKLHLAHWLFLLEPRAQLNIARASSQLSCKKKDVNTHTHTDLLHSHILQAEKKINQNPNECLNSIIKPKRSLDRKGVEWASSGPRDIFTPESYCH